MNHSKTKQRKRKNLLFACIVLVTVVAIVTVVIFAIKNSENVVNNNREYLKDTTRQTAGQIHDAIEGGRTNITWISSVAEDTLISPRVDIKEFQNVLDSSMFDSIEYIDSKGYEHNILGSVADVSDRECFLNSMKGESGIELVMNSPLFGRTALRFYAPLRYRDEIVGSIVGLYEAGNRLVKLLDQRLFNEKVEAYLCMSDGVIIASNMEIDTSDGLSIVDVLGDRVVHETDKSRLIYSGSLEVIEFEANETGGCVCGIDDSDWYLVQIFPREINGETIHKANSMGIGVTTFLILILAALIIIIYISMSKQRKEMKKLLAQTQEFSKAKTSFLFNMSHDIRTPMNAIVGFTAMAKKRIANPEKIKEYLDKIDTAGNQLLSLINQVLEMSRIESGKVVLEEKRVSLREKENVVMIIYGEQAESKDIRFYASLKNVVHDNVYADADRLEQIVNNIIGNALKYTNPGGSVRYEIEEKPHNVPKTSIYKFTVSDTGIGMSAEFQNHIFEEFSRENTSTVSKIQGTGLGMSIVAQLVKLMNGKINILSQTGVGTSISVEIPLRWSEEENLEIYKEKNDGNINIEGMKILLVEDNEMNREIAEEILAEKGIAVTSAEDGCIAVDIMKAAKKGDFDLILMDVQMPHMDGYEATRTIRSMDDKDIAGIPIVAMTANAFEEDKRNAREAGMNDHLSKPIDINELVRVIASFKKKM